MSSDETVPTKKSTKDEVKETIEKTKQVVSDVQHKIEDRLSMAGLLKQGQLSLESFLSPDFDVEEQIPVAILSGAKGVLFLTVVKGGLGVGGSIGTGFSIVRREYAQGWSGPCAVGMVGLQWGFNIGVEKTEHIIVLRDDTAVKTLIGKGQIKLGVDASIAIGPKGRDAAIALSVNDKGYAPTASYSLSKGAYIGVSLEGQVITIRNDCNEDYYKQKVEPSKIFQGKVDPPDDQTLKTICVMLDEYTKRQGKSLKDLFSGHKNKEEQKEDQ